MKVRVGTLKRLIREAVNQMKLGVASANPPGEAWGLKDEPEPEVDRPFIAKPDEEPMPMPDERTMAWYTGRLGRGTKDMAGDAIDMSDRDMAFTDPELGLGLDEPFTDTEPATVPVRKKAG